eukprot:m.344190 g.344190  ORF g.344190 m.344190 type:complete len:1320 (-) comp23997_c0_seq1:26-3985(-)
MDKPADTKTETLKRKRGGGGGGRNTKKRDNEASKLRYDELEDQLLFNEDLKFAELHTHLLGMGDHHFWLENILLSERRCPRTWTSETKKAIGPFIWNKDKRAFFSRENTYNFFKELLTSEKANTTFGNHDDKYIKEIFLTTIETIEAVESDMKRHRLKWSNFSYDLVLRTEHLAKALGIEWSANRSGYIEQMIEEKLGYRYHAESPFGYYIIFDVREQEFQVVHGILNGNFQNHLEKKESHEHKIVMANLRNCFSMLQVDGSACPSESMQYFHGMFTPEFYPRRFVLKDSIYSQRLDLLIYLLRHTLLRYTRCRPAVDYVEYSVGVGDISRPWILDALASLCGPDDSLSTFRREIMKLDDNTQKWLQWFSSWVKGKKFKSIDYKFLAAFDRSKVCHPGTKTPMTQREATELLIDNETAISRMLCECVAGLVNTVPDDETRIFKVFEDKLDKMLRENRESQKFTETFQKMVVGFDLVGDEYGFPYNPFVTTKFASNIKKLREHNRKFGVRVHCAENVPHARDTHPDYHVFANHMFIVALGLMCMKGLGPENIRIGHGVAFVRMLKTDPQDVKKDVKRASYTKVVYVQKVFKSLCDKEHEIEHGIGPKKVITLEINPTSNEYLLKSHADTAPNYYIPKTYDVVISTDDDGIWPINRCKKSHPGHSSVSAELCNLLSNMDEWPEGLLETLAYQSHKAKFHEDNHVEENNDTDESSDNNDEDNNNGNDTNFSRLKQIVRIVFDTCLLPPPDSGDNLYNFWEELSKPDPAKDLLKTLVPNDENAKDLPSLYNFTICAMGKRGIDTLKEIWEYDEEKKKVFFQIVDKCKMRFMRHIPKKSKSDIKNISIHCDNDCFVLMSCFSNKQTEIFECIRRHMLFVLAENEKNEKEEKKFKKVTLHCFISGLKQREYDSFLDNFEKEGNYEVMEGLNWEIFIFSRVHPSRKTYKKQITKTIQIEHNFGLYNYGSKGNDPDHPKRLCVAEVEFQRNIAGVGVHGRALSNMLHSLVYWVSKEKQLEILDDININELFYPFLPLVCQWSENIDHLLEILQFPNDLLTTQNWKTHLQKEGHLTKGSSGPNYAKIEDLVKLSKLEIREIKELLRLTDEMKPSEILAKNSYLEKKERKEFLRMNILAIVHWGVKGLFSVLPIERFKKYNETFRAMEKMDETKILFPTIETEENIIICKKFEVIQQKAYTEEISSLWKVYHQKWCETSVSILKIVESMEDSETLWCNLIVEVMKDADDETWDYYSVEYFKPVIEYVIEKQDLLVDHGKKTDFVVILRCLQNSYYWKLGYPLQKEVLSKVEGYSSLISRLKEAKKATTF